MVQQKVNKLSQLLMRHRTLCVLLFQALLVFCALALACLLRFEFTLPNRLLFLSAAPILILIRLGAIRCFHLHYGWWRYTGVGDAVNLVKAVGLGTIVFFVFVRCLLGVTAFPRSIYVLEAILTANFLAGARLLSRALAESVRVDVQSSRKVLLIGAGFAAQMILREMKRPDSGYCAIGCVDDDPTKVGMKIHGVQVLGTVSQLPAILNARPVDEVLITVPSATGKQMQRFVEICEQADVNFKTVPALRDIISGQVSINHFRNVRLEDLLGRDPVEVDLQSVRKQIEGRVVLVTGAAGSIGSELCRQVLKFNPAPLLCLDQSETGIFYLQIELAKQENRAPVVFCVADVGDIEPMHRLFAEYQPEVVFHAAAYKHVPVMEQNVHEAVKNNVIALLTLLEIAEENGCRNFVLISSDKAVNPASIMGATKRVGEMILSCQPANRMRCVSVRFGNVLGSNGSVVPVLQEQLRNNQRLTVTHPEIERFFMTTCEATALVLQAFAIGNHGEILVLDMGKRVRILDLARTLIRLSGKSPREVGITFTGLREGEKLIEELFYPSEEVHSTSFPKIKRARNTLDGWPKLQRQLDELRAALVFGSADTIRAKLREIVPEYSYRSDHRPEQVRSLRPQVALRKAAGQD